MANGSRERDDRSNLEVAARRLVKLLYGDFDGVLMHEAAFQRMGCLRLIDMVHAVGEGSAVAVQELGNERIHPVRVAGGYASARRNACGQPHR